MRRQALAPALSLTLPAPCLPACPPYLPSLQEMRHPNIILFMGVVLEPAAVVTGAWLWWLVVLVLVQGVGGWVGGGRSWWSPLL